MNKYSSFTGKKPFVNIMPHSNMNIMPHSSILPIYGAQTLPRHILCCEMIQSWNFQTGITQSFLKSKFMIKSVNIENCIASSKLQKQVT